MKTIILSQAQKDKVISLIQHWGCHPGCPLKEGETGEWKRDFCVFNRTQERRKDTVGQATFFIFFYWIGPKNIFTCPLDSCTMGIMLQVILGMFQFLLLTSIPTSHAKVCSLYAFGLNRLHEEVSLPSAMSSRDLFPAYSLWWSLDWQKVAWHPFLNEFVLENMWDFYLCGSYPVGQWHLSLQVQWQENSI